MAQPLKTLKTLKTKCIAYNGARTKTHATNTLRWKKAGDLLKELEKLNFKDAARAVRKQVAMEMKQAKNSEEDESVTDESSSSSENDITSESNASSEEESEDEASVDEDESEEISSSEEESSSKDETESEEESEEEEEEDETQSCPTTRSQRKTMFGNSSARPPCRRAVSFSEAMNDIHLLSPKKAPKEVLFYSRDDIERFRMEDRVRKTEEAQANLEALIAQAQITMSAC